jgi:hypothetical protein
MISCKTYLRNQIIVNAVVNFLINSIIAYFAYRSRGNLPYLEIAIDILITVAIIAFLVSWIAIPSTRKELLKGRISPLPSDHRNLFSVKLPSKPLLGALLVTGLFVLVFGGLLLAGSIYLFSPNGMANWSYFVTKTLYTGICAGLVSAFTIFNIYKEARPAPAKF